MVGKWLRKVQRSFDPTLSQNPPEEIGYFDPNPDLGGDESRMRLHEAFKEVAANQIRDYPEAMAAYERLMADGISDFDARMFLANLASRATAHVFRTKEPMDPELYARWLSRLPALPDDDDEE